MFRYTGGDSILAPGGSVSNMYALMIARHKLYPQVSMLMQMLVHLLMLMLLLILRLMLIWFTQHKKYGMRAIKGQLIMYTSQHVSSTKHHHRQSYTCQPSSST